MIKKLKKQIHHFFNYTVTHPAAKIKYIAREMHLWAQSNALYLCKSRAQSRTWGIVYLSQKTTFPILPDSLPPTHNGTILVVSKIIDAVMLSAQEARIGIESVSG